jgi:hypothetical protein
MSEAIGCVFGVGGKAENASCTLTSAGLPHRLPDGGFRRFGRFMSSDLLTNLYPSRCNPATACWGIGGRNQPMGETRVGGVGFEPMTSASASH